MPQILAFETVDVFTQTPYEGNPLAIVHIPSNATVTQEQKGRVAKEFNLSETIFIHENETDPLVRRVDIFLATGEELPFAGHPTIGALSHIGKRHVTATSSAPITLHEIAGVFKASFDPSTQVALASIPHNIHVHKSATAEQIAQHQAGLIDYWQQRKDRYYPLVSPVEGMSFVLVDLDDLDILGRTVSQPREMTEIQTSLIDKEWQPSFTGAYYYVVLGLKVSGNGTPSLEIRTRMFASDVPEDPATGSAACTLAGYLSIQRRKEQTPDTPWKRFTAGDDASQTRYLYEIVQGVEMARKSVITVEVIMKAAQGTDIDEIILQGQAVKVMEGTLKV